MGIFTVERKLELGVAFVVLMQLGMIIWGASQVYHTVEYIDEKVSNVDKGVTESKKEFLRYIEDLNDRILYVERQQRELIKEVEKLKQEIR